MRFHPSIMMLGTWLFCIAAFYVLPFQLENRTITLTGIAILASFLAAFCAGAAIAGKPCKQQPWRDDIVVDFHMTDRLLMGASVVALISFIIAIQDRNVLDLADAFQKRSDSATALLLGGQSESTLSFQIGFLTYPAGLVFLLREITFQPRPSPLRIGFFGLAPVIIASLAMGGRAPLFYALLLVVFGYGLRRSLFGKRPGQAKRPAGRRGAFKMGLFSKVAIALIGGVAMVYFVEVFFTRAEVVGGVEGMLGVANVHWGVNFEGTGSNLIYSSLGSGGTYIIFIFSWYLLQGFVMSNSIFSDYDGPMLFGAYGIDLASAAMRRINGDFVADGFGDLLQMNVYGFLPSAFGSLYIDFGYFGLLICVAWGWAAGIVYNRLKSARDPRWLLAAPFVTIGILFSLVNTPLGFANGFVNHLWLLAAFVVTGVRVKRPKDPLAPAAPPQAK